MFIALRVLAPKAMASWDYLVVFKCQYNESQFAPIISLSRQFIASGA